MTERLVYKEKFEGLGELSIRCERILSFGEEGKTGIPVVWFEPGDTITKFFVLFTGNAADVPEHMDFFQTVSLSHGIVIHIYM
jgi:hypothetical protein